MCITVELYLIYNSTVEIAISNYKDDHLN